MYGKQNRQTNRQISRLANWQTGTLADRTDRQIGTERVWDRLKKGKRLRQTKGARGLALATNKCDSNTTSWRRAKGLYKRRRRGDNRVK